MKNQRELTVVLMKALLENNFRFMFLNDDCTVTGSADYGYVTENGIYSPVEGASEEELKEFKEQYGISKETPYDILRLGNINDIIINYNKGSFDEDMMDEIADDMYNILESKYDLQAIESYPGR